MIIEAVISHEEVGILLLDKAEGQTLSIGDSGGDAGE